MQRKIIKLKIEYLYYIKMDVDDINKNLLKEYQTLLANQWKFLNLGWPSVVKRKNHRTIILKIQKIKEVKDLLYKKLGVIPVYFFLVILFGAYDYKGPYNNIEKGLLMLYYLVENKSMDEMNEYIPKSSFYEIYREFYINKYEKLRKILNYSLENMFSNVKIRILSAMIKNPQLFKQVTLHLDGHDTRGIEIGAKHKADYYSYKLKKSGFRTQVCIDINNMILYISESEPYGKNNDGSMFVNMSIENKVDKMDCLALDGGYNLYINQIITNTELNNYNFIYPIRKEKNINLNSTEIEYNEQFGSFRSKIETVFSDISFNFKRLNNKKPIRTTNKTTFNLQLRIASVLLNIKNFVNLGNIKHEEYHSYWLEEDFDYKFDNSDNENIIASLSFPSINERYNNSKTMQELQIQFLQLSASSIDNTIVGSNNNDDSDDINMNIPIYDENDYEVEKVIEHKGIIIEDSYYLVKWKDYSDTENTWIHYDKFNTKY